MAEDDTLNSDPRRISRCVEADDRQSSSWSFSRVNTLESENRILIYNISSFCLHVVSGWTSALKVCLFERASLAGDGVGKFPFYLSGKWLGLHPWTRFASGNTLQCRLRWFLFVAMKKILTQFSMSDNYSIIHSQAVCTVCTGHCQEERKQENAILQRRQLFITVVSLSPNQKWVFWRRLLFEPHGCFDLSATAAFCHVGQRGFAFWGFMCRLVCGLWPASSGLNKNRVFDDGLLCNHGKLEQRRISYDYLCCHSEWSASASRLIVLILHKNRV